MADSSVVDLEQSSPITVAARVSMDHVTVLLQLLKQVASMAGGDQWSISMCLMERLDLLQTLGADQCACVLECVCMCGCKCVCVCMTMCESVSCMYICLLACAYV